MAKTKRRGRSPIKLVCERPYVDVGDDMRVCRWTAGPGTRGAQFRDRRAPDSFAILHPSTREVGRWQLSLFDSRGASGDLIRSTATKALEDGGINETWKLEDVS